MTIEQILQLKGAGYTAAEIAQLAPSISDPALPAASEPEITPDPKYKPVEIDQKAIDQNAAVLEAINKLTETIQAGNRGSNGAAAQVDTSSIFDTIINGINNNK